MNRMNFACLLLLSGAAAFAQEPAAGQGAFVTQSLQIALLRAASRQLTAQLLRQPQAHLPQGMCGDHRVREVGDFIIGVY